MRDQAALAIRARQCEEDVLPKGAFTCSNDPDLYDVLPLNLLTNGTLHSQNANAIDLDRFLLRLSESRFREYKKCDSPERCTQPPRVSPLKSTPRGRPARQQTKTMPPNGAEVQFPVLMALQL